MDLSFFNGKRVFLTGHTGFKGAWLSRILQNAGAIVTGYALEPEEKSLFKIANIAEGMTSVYGDVAAFREKRDVDGSWINGGFMVLEPEVFDLLIDDTTVLEQKPMETLAETGELSAFRHSGFWHCMDTLRDRQNLEAIWASGDAPWKRW